MKALAAGSGSSAAARRCAGAAAGAEAGGGLLPPATFAASPGSIVQARLTNPGSSLVVSLGGHETVQVRSTAAADGQPLTPLQAGLRFAHDPAGAHDGHAASLGVLPLVRGAGGWGVWVVGTLGACKAEGHQTGWMHWAGLCLCLVT